MRRRRVGYNWCALCYFNRWQACSIKTVEMNNDIYKVYTSSARVYRIAASQHIFDGDTFYQNDKRYSIEQWNMHCCHSFVKYWLHDKLNTFLHSIIIQQWKIREKKKKITNTEWNVRSSNQRKSFILTIRGWK